MQTIRDRAKDLLPSVLLTLLSIVQALALEMLWSRLGTSAHLWGSGWDAVVGWTQVAAMLVGILQIWLFYTSVALRFRWVPELQDSIVPFVVGILEFTLIGLMGPENLAAWFYLLALVFAVSAWASHTIFVRARQDPENREFFANVDPAGLEDFLYAGGSVLALVLAGGLVQLTGSRGGLAFAGLLIAGGLLVYQIELTRRYWNRSIAVPE